MSAESAEAEAVKIQIRSKIAELREMGRAWAREADNYHREITAYREVCAWVADKLHKLAALEPHEWDRATLRELAEALTSNPRLKGTGRRVVRVSDEELERDIVIWKGECSVFHRGTDHDYQLLLDLRDARAVLRKIASLSHASTCGPQCAVCMALKEVGGDA